MMRTPLSLLAAGTVALMPFLTVPAEAAPPTPGQDPLEMCLLEGGDVIEQPPGSSIATCCTDDGCVICAADFSDCSFDPAYSQPVLNQTPFGAADVLAPPTQPLSGFVLQVPQFMQLH